MATVSFDGSQLKRTRPREHALRFAFGGTVSVVAWLIGQRWGPLVGGLFLAFPALLPASVTLVEEHDGRRQASDGAAGAACGSVGLIAFGAVVWTTAGRWPIAAVLLAATLVWLALSAALWRLCFGRRAARR